MLYFHYANKDDWGVKGYICIANLKLNLVYLLIDTEFLSLTCGTFEIFNKDHLKIILNSSFKIIIFNGYKFLSK